MAPPPGLRSVKRRGTLTATELARSKSETSEQMEEELFTEEEWDKKKWLTYNFLQITTCIAAGVVFGVAAEKSRGTNKQLRPVKYKPTKLLFFNTIQFFKMIFQSFSTECQSY